MIGSYATGLRLRFFGLLLLFFNCVYAAGPAIEASFDDDTALAGLLQTATILDYDAEVNFTVSYVKPSSRVSLFSQKTISCEKEMRTLHTLRFDTYLAWSALLLRPDYYTFLSRFYLF